MDDLRVLLVDDEEELVETLAERLELRGISAEAVTRGEDALRLLLDYTFDVVLLDVKMPGIGGLEVLKLIRRQRPNMQVILITGHGSTEDGENGLEEGAFDYVVKPIDIETLIGKMKDAARKARGLVGS
jgi:DNA-binding response OmpR family regulator